MSHEGTDLNKGPGAPWSPVTLTRAAVHRWRIGPLDITVQRTDHEWHLSTSRRSMDTRNGPETEMHRGVAQPQDNTIRCGALLPDRPLVIRPDAPLGIHPGREATFYVGIPVWVRVRAGVQLQDILCDLPTAILSRSWFGTPIEGEACYSVRSSAKRDPAEISSDPHIAACTITIRNGSPAPLHVERLCIRSQDLPVFGGKDRLWTVPARVTYRGEGEWSRIVYGTRPPDIAGRTHRLGEPRQKPARGIVAKTFDILRTLGDEG